MSEVQKHRERLNLTQEALAARAKISVRTVQRLEAGRKPKGHTLKALAIALGVEMDELVSPKEMVSKEMNFPLIRIINISSLFLIFIPLASILLPLIITLLKKAFNPLTKQIISIQILWTCLFPLIILVAAYVGKVIGLDNQVLPVVILLMFILNTYIIVRNSIELNRNKKLFIDLKFSFL